MIDKCHRCGKESILEDKKQGNILCENCGLVITSHIIDFTNEWRLFSENKRNDSNRVGMISNPLMKPDMCTVIGKGLRNSNHLNERLIKTQNQMNTRMSNHFLIKIFNKNNLIMDKTFLSKTTKEKTEELFRLYFDYLTLRSDGSRTRSSLGKKEATSVLAASIFICCKNEGIPRTFKEISEITRITKKEIGAKVRAIQKNLRGATLKTKGFQNIVHRFCSKLNLPYFIAKLTENLTNFVQKKEGMYGKTHISVVAAATYIVSQLPCCIIKHPPKKIAEVAGISEFTLKLTYKAIYPYRNEILKYLTKESFLLKMS